MTAEARTSSVQQGREYTGLLALVQEAGLLNRRPGYYIAKITVTLLLFTAGWAAGFMTRTTWWCLAAAALLAVASTQIGFVGHDAGHKQIFRADAKGNRRSHQLGLLLGNLLVGLSTDWWDNKHTKHHGNPNHVGKDPDIGAGAIVFTEEDAANRKGFGGLMTSIQAYFFFPLLLLEGLNLHFQSVRSLLNPKTASKRVRRLELSLLGLHAGLYLAAVFLMLSPLHGLAFIAVHQGLWGFFMGITFAPNHKGMEIIQPGTKLDFLRKQVLTSRNIRGGWIIGWLFGGLNYQIEHHLFPNMPRPNLRRAREIVRAYCAKVGVPYTETTVWRSYMEVLRHLRNVGRRRKSRSPVSPA